MPRVAQAMRQKYHWIPLHEPLYLVMDNAGSHGTENAIKQYTAILAIYNIHIVWQVPRSPETNMLDLGIWMAIQCAVTRVQRGKRCQTNALANSVQDTWKEYLNPQAFTNVHGRIRVVLNLIVEGQGGNENIESKRGKLFHDCTLPENDAAATENDDGNGHVNAPIEPNTGVLVPNGDVSDNESIGFL